MVKGTDKSYLITKYNYIDWLGQHKRENPRTNRKGQETIFRMRQANHSKSIIYFVG